MFIEVQVVIDHNPPNPPIVEYQCINLDHVRRVTQPTTTMDRDLSRCELVCRDGERILVNESYRFLVNRLTSEGL